MKVSPWALVFLAGLTEIVWAIAMDRSDGFSNIGYDVVVVIFLIVGMVLLNKAIGSGIPVGTAYAVWVGIGAVGTAIASVILGLEPAVPTKFLFLCMIVAGIIGLKVTSENRCPMPSRRPHATERLADGPLPFERWDRRRHACPFERMVQAA